MPETFTISDYARLLGDLRAPRPTVIGDWSEFVHPHTAPDDESWPAPTRESVRGEPSEWYDEDPRLSPWAGHVFGRLDTTTRRLMARWGVELVLGDIERFLTSLGYSADVVLQPRRCLVLAWEPFEQGDPPGLDSGATAAMYRDRPSLVQAATRMSITASGSRLSQTRQAALFDALPDLVAFVRDIPPVAAADAWESWHSGSADGFLVRWWRISRSRLAVARVTDLQIEAALAPDLPDHQSADDEPEHCHEMNMVYASKSFRREADPDGELRLASGRVLSRERLLGPTIHLPSII